MAGERLLLFHREGSREVVEALRVSDGERIWEFAYDTTYKDDFGFENGPRATPVIADGRVYTFGAAGVLHSLDLETGTKHWSVDTHSEFGVRKGFFGAASTPLVLGGKVIANIGGSDGAGIVAFDADSGAKVWTATDHDASYSSPVAAQIDGALHAIFFTREGLVALKPETGKVAYEQRWRSRSHASVNAATPVVLGDIVFLSSSYGTGAIAMRLRNGDLEELWSGEDVIDNHYSSCVRSGSTLFGFHGRQEYGQSFRAADLTTGEVLWSSERMPQARSRGLATGSCCCSSLASCYWPPLRGRSLRCCRGRRSSDGRLGPSRPLRAVCFSPVTKIRWLACGFGPSKAGPRPDLDSGVAGFSLEYLRTVGESRQGEAGLENSIHPLRMAVAVAVVPVVAQHADDTIRTHTRQPQTLKPAVGYIGRTARSATVSRAKAVGART